MEQIMKELADLGKEIESAKRNISQLEGRKEEVSKRIKDELGVTTLAELDALIGASEEKQPIKKAEIEKAFATLKETFKW